MKRYEFKVTVDLQDNNPPNNVAHYFRNVTYDGYEIMGEGESIVSLEYTEVPIPELPT
jgi:hypothetical protein